MRPAANVWHVAREYAGIAEAGGVKDVVRGLAEAHARAGGTPSVVLPLYGFVSRPPAERVAAFTLSLPDQDRGNALCEEEVTVYAARAGGVRLLLVDSPRYAAKQDVYTYSAADEARNHWQKRGTGHWDFHQLNLILQRAALETALALGEAPDVFHCHDGHAAFLPALLREDPRYAATLARSGAIVTIHNAGAGYHQEVWDPAFAGLLTGLGPRVLEKGLLNTAIDPFLLASSYALMVTVSENYARELLAEKDAEMSGGLGRVFRERGSPLAGITNGIDPAPWDPRSPGTAGIPYAFDPSTGDLEGKRQCRRALAQRIGASGFVQPGSGPLYAFVGRLTGQKGIDVLFEALKGLTAAPRQRDFVVLGQGEKEKEAMLGWLAADASSAGRLSFTPRYDPALASLIYAASDFFLIPSAFEPCGLTDFIAQLYGSIPIVHHVGGLVKVRDGETGFSYNEHDPAALAAAVDRTGRLFDERQELLDTIRRRAFQEVFALHTWDHVLAEGYLPLYNEAAAGDAWTRR